MAAEMLLPNLDNKRIFLRMFKRKLKDEFEFSENSFIDQNKKTANYFDRIIYVIHSKEELLSLLKEGPRSNSLVCLFDKQFYSSLSFLEAINNLILFDESKTSREIFKEVKLFLKKRLDSKSQNKSTLQSNILQTKSNEYYKAIYFLM
ncbi:hypothetical protein HNP37_002383 [Flavobacterium nitrogenifigens]|uniref:Uncharacterized protein n=2 Tax=Flavobacterium TaxID=237 RepID=A0A7W7N6Y4_9FLAO|nr:MULTISPECIES: hypothetical protein [Flavobacterium]MBB4802310.1 hypothetical protein [Flavobacterium nitrogenifigens]MBB6387268.1 hypothetical protein [Flavobacterium notoginsengisoli]